MWWWWFYPTPSEEWGRRGTPWRRFTVEPCPKVWTRGQKWGAEDGAPKRLGCVTVKEEVMCVPAKIKEIHGSKTSQIFKQIFVI